MCKVYTEYHGTSEIEHGLCACTVDNPLAKARGLSRRTGAQTMLYLSHENQFPRQRKERDELHLPSVVPDIQWPSLPLRLLALGKELCLHTGRLCTITVGETGAGCNRGRLIFDSA